MKRLLALVLASGYAPSLRAQSFPEPASIKSQAEIIVQIEQAIYAVHSPHFRGADETKRGLENKMGLRDKNDNLIRAPNADDIKKLSCFWKNECEEYARATRIFDEAKREEAEFYAEAMRLSNTAYKIKYYRGEQTVVNGRFQGRGKQIEFKPRFSDTPQEHEKDNPNSAFENQPSFIRPDMAMIFRPTAFLNRDGKPDPAMAAFALQHEAYHMMLLLEPNHDLRNEPKIERDLVYWALIREDSYQFKSGDWVRLLKDMGGWSELSGLWGNQMTITGESPYTSPEKFRAIKVAPEKLEAIGKAVERDVQLFSQADTLLESGRLDDAIEFVRARAESEFLGSMDNDMLGNIIQNWKKARELKAQSAEKESALVVEKAVLEMKRCGSEPILKKGWTGAEGFRIAGPSSWRMSWDYRFRGSVSLDQVKVILLFAKACMDASLESEGISPCNDGLDIAVSHWSQEEFRNGVVVDGENYQGNASECINHMRENFSLPMSYTIFQKLAEEGAKPLLPRFRELRKYHNRPDGSKPGGNKPPGREKEGEDGGGGKGGCTQRGIWYPKCY